VLKKSECNFHWSTGKTIESRCTPVAASQALIELIGETIGDIFCDTSFIWRARWVSNHGINVYHRLFHNHPTALTYGCPVAGASLLLPQPAQRRSMQPLKILAKECVLFSQHGDDLVVLVA
jgi:hypothetical protein